MILSDGTVISRAEVSPHKFGGDPMAEYLWLLSLDSSYPDRTTGDCCDWGEWVAQFGKRTVHSNSQGFVWAIKHDSLEAANAAFDEIDADFRAWDEQEEP